MFGADSIYRIGKTHRVCQDYAEHVPGQNSAVAWLSDGCSSAPDTDWGARFLVRAARLRVGLIHSTWRTAEYACNMANMASISFECINATLMQVAVEPQDLTATVMGDGVLAARTHCGGLETVTIEYPSGAPYYPRMALCGPTAWPNGIYAKYLEKFGREYTVTTSCGGVWGETETRILPDDSSNHVDVFRFPRSGYDLLVAFSDGIHTFTRPVVSETSRSIEKIPAAEVIAEFLAFKSMAGDFVARRCQAAFKAFAAKGIEHSDDFSMAAVWTPPLEEQP